MISVLLVDDEPAHLDIAQLFLENTGSFTVDTCQSGSEALSLLSKKRYDVIVSDYEMPEMDGILLLRTLKDHGDLTPFIIFTGNGPEQVVINALNNGAIFYLPKGCDPKAQFAELSQKCHLAVQQRRSEIALKKSEEKYRALVGHVHEGILILDLQGSILLANNAAAKTIEADSTASITGRNVLEFIAPESREMVLKDCVRAAQGHDAFMAEYEAVTVRGNHIPVASIGKGISYEGRPAILISLRAVPLKKSLEGAPPPNEVMFRMLMEHTEYGVFILSGDRFRYTNPYFTTMTGYSKEELQRIDLWDLIREDFRDRFREKIQDWQKAGKHTVDHSEITLMTKGGTECQARFGIISGEFDGKPVILGTALDVTGHRIAESRLGQLNKKLHLLNEVTHHDLLNNFTALFGYFEIIKENTVDSDTLEFMKKQEIILSAIREQIHFTGYYQNIGNVKPQWQYVENAVREAASILPLDTVVLKLDLGKTEIQADPLLIRVFYNLMENALRHGEHVTEIRYHCEKHPDGLVLIYEDNGVGIPAKNKERIFLKGVGKNSGLGLFLIKEILAITRMTIRENGEPGKGARFEIFVPEGKYR